MKSILILSAFAFLLTANAQAEDQIYRCNGVYQNRACSSGEKGGLVNLPTIAYVSAAKFQQEKLLPLTPAPGYARGRLAPPEPVTIPEPISPRSPMDAQFLHDVSQRAAYLRANTASLLRNQGPTATMHDLDRLKVQLDTVCRQDSLADTDATRAECENANRDLMSALRSVRTY